MEETYIRNDSIQGFYLPDRKVYLMGRRIGPARSNKLNNHSPDGFNWGYGGDELEYLAFGTLKHPKVYGK